MPYAEGLACLAWKVRQSRMLKKEMGKGGSSGYSEVPTAKGVRRTTNMSLNDLMREFSG